MNSLRSNGSWAVALSLLLASMHSGADEAPQAARYTFSWPLEAGAAAPRGGISKEAPVQIEDSPAAAWRALRAPGLSGFERDRRAILALVGSYRVTFDFLEVVNFTSRPRDRPTSRGAPSACTSTTTTDAA